jgi:hypothetical protein
MGFRLKCRVCNSLFLSYEEYERHVIKEHKDNLKLRFRSRVLISSLSFVSALLALLLLPTAITTSKEKKYLRFVSLAILQYD